MPAGYRLYAASPADFVASGQVGQPLTIATATLTVHDAPTAGTQVTDLLNAAEAAVTQVVTDDFGNFRFFARDTLGVLWVTAGGSTRYSVQPADIGTRILGLDKAAADASAAQQSAAAAEAAAKAATSGAVADATTTSKGVLLLSGDLGGTALVPLVPELANKAGLGHGHSTAEINAGIWGVDRMPVGVPIYVIKSEPTYGSAANAWPTARPGGTSRSVTVIYVGDRVGAEPAAAIMLSGVDFRKFTP